MNAFFRIFFTAAISFFLFPLLQAQKLTPRDYFMRGSAQYRCNACQTAVIEFSRAIALDNQHANAYMGRSLSYLCLKNYDMAVSDIRRAMGINEKEPLFVHTYGRIRQARGDLRGALIEFTKATEMDDDCWQAWYSKGEVLIQLREPQKAIAELDRALSSNPDCSICWLEKGRAKLKEQSYSNAVEFLNTATDAMPLYAEGFMLKGMAYQGMDDWQNGLRNFSRALELEPQNSNAFLERAKCLYKLNEPAQAQADLESAVKFNHKNAEAWLYKGRILRDQGELKKALNFYSKAVKHDPNLVAGFLERANLYRDLMKKDKAIADLDRSVDLDAGNLDLRNHVGLMKYELGDAPGAFIEFKYVLRQEPNNADALYGLGLAHYRMGRKKQACEAWSMAAEKGQMKAVDELRANCTD